MNCLGYFDNAQRPLDSGEDSDDESELDPRIGFVYEKPRSSDENSSLISLYDLFESTARPPLTDCIGLAKSVATSLFLPAFGRLRSDNILLHRTSSGLVSYDQPYITGFDFARPAPLDEQTEVPGDDPALNMYRHPHTQSYGFGPRESFRKSFDIYSLGTGFLRSKSLFDPIVV